jgi:hypothetical protein
MVDTDPRDLEKFKGTGYELVPLHRWDARDKNGKDGKARELGKAPRDSGWRKKAYSFAECLAHLRGGSNVGVRLRPQDLVLDVDPRNFPEGRDSLAELVAAVGIDLERYPHTVTGSGGHHYYMRKDPGSLLRVTLPDFPGIELKQCGVQVVAPGSVHPCGGRYRWDDFAPPIADGAPDAPERLIALYRRPSRPPQQGGGELTPEQLEPMLAALDPTGFRDHGRWLHLMMACHHATNGEGMDEFLDWSASDPEYANRRGENARRWDSLHPSGPASSVTVGTLYKELSDAGRADLIPRTAAEADFPDWDPSGGGDDAPDGPLRRLNRECWATDAGGKFRIFRRSLEPMGTDLPDRWTWRCYARPDFENLHCHNRIEIPWRKNPVPVGQAWIEWPHRRNARGVIFDPERDHPGFLNLWQGMAVEPRQGDWSLMQELVRDGICSGDEAVHRYVLDWLAYTVQHPGHRPEVALVMRGKKGAGKGTLAKALMDMFGPHAIQISSPDHMTGHFNAHLRDCVLLFADEAFWAGDRAGEAVLKRLITEPTMMYEQKGVDVVTGPNMLHVLMASNSQWVVPAGIDGERRYAVTDVSPRYVGNVAFWKALNIQLRAGGLSAMLFDLLARDLRGGHPRESIPVTRALTEQKERSLDPVAGWWLDRLHEGDLRPLTGKWEDGWVSFLRSDLQQSLEAHMQRFGSRRERASVATQLGMEMRNLVPGLRRMRVRVPDHRMDVTAHGDGMAWAYQVPPLQTCRDHFARDLLNDPNYQWGGDAEDDDPWLV